ncbi:hypothetical protein OG462_24210 [Streptomyces sp. NBC_01077]|uniref:hypothetical protein n=1 Tax=Streptomyces sp. NBC_01077 TaxID=2903746 RepID=UPI00386C134B|nr:hypothetical protein OG462_24210 [Streptomyces sp. NBC_01077]
MTEIIAAVIGGAFALGAAVITVRWTRSRSNSDGGPDQLPPADAAHPGDSPVADSHSIGSTSPDGVNINAQNSGQVIGTNHGTVSQTNYRNSKR